MGVKGKMWHVIKRMFESSKTVALLEAEKSDVFNVEQGVALSCSLSPILFSYLFLAFTKESRRGWTWDTVK